MLYGYEFRHLTVKPGDLADRTALLTHLRQGWQIELVQDSLSGGLAKDRKQEIFLRRRVWRWFLKPFMATVSPYERPKAFAVKRS